MTSSSVVGDPGVEYLDRARTHEFFSRLKAETVAMLGIGPGSQILDLGCGTGDDAAAISAVAPDVFSVGLDLSSVHETPSRHSIDTAAMALRSSSPTGTHFRFGAVALTAAEPNGHCKHIADAAQVVNEIGRTLRPGGRIVLSEPDWLSCVLAGASESVSERVLTHWIRRSSNPRVGRNLAGLLVDSGLELVDLRCDAVIYRSLDEVDTGAFPLRRAATHAVAEGAIEQQTADTWIDELEASSGGGQFVFSVPIVTVVGIKPPGP